MKDCSNEFKSILRYKTIFYLSLCLSPFIFKIINKILLLLSLDTTMHIILLIIGMNLFLLFLILLAASIKCPYCGYGFDIRTTIDSHCPDCGVKLRD